MTGQIPDDLLYLHQADMGVGAMAWGDRVLWNYGRNYTDNDIEDAFRTSLAAGITLIDTAEIYGAGRSEYLIGKLLKNYDKPIHIATKFMPFPWRLSRGAFMNALHRSLERLGLDRVDLYQVHWPFPPRPVEFWVEGLAQAAKAGLTRAVGVSNYSKNQMQRAYTVLAKYDLPLASNQVRYNLIDRTVEKNGLLDRCHELGIRLIAYSPLAQGLLTGKYTPDNPPSGIRGRAAAGKLSRIQPLIHLLTEIGKQHDNRTAGQVALNWTICKGTLPIPGAKTGQQAAQNAGSAGWRLTAEEVKALDEASDRIIK